MTRSKMFACLLLVLTVVALIAYPVYAALGRGSNTAADAKKIAAQFDQNKMTLAKMVAAAEEHSKGRAISVISDLREHGQAAVHVYCVAGDAAAPKIMMCYVDHATGKVRGMKEVHEFPITASHAEGEHASHEADHDDTHKEGDHPHGKAPSVPGTARMITDQTVDAACGACIYKMPGVEGCPLAVKIDGKAYLVEGAKWPNHDYCDRNCQAVVSGRVEGDPPKFIAISFEPKK